MDKYSDSFSIAVAGERKKMYNKGTPDYTELTVF